MLGLFYGERPPRKTASVRARTVKGKSQGWIRKRTSLGGKAVFLQASGMVESLASRG
jgi:hypothetical protein